MGSAEKEVHEMPEGGESSPATNARRHLKGPGDRIGQFRIERELGHGGAGIVYLARDTKLDRQVAIKSLPPEFANDARSRVRFQREARLLASLSHPNIAAIHEELEEAEGLTYLVLEYVPGETLGQRIARGPIAAKETLTIGLEIAEAMAAAHANGVIHRDLKPENIKITPEGRAKVLDFGIAKVAAGPGAVTSTLTEPGHVIGTPRYMSPEQARGESADPRTDIWSFGCVLYEALTGRCAFPGETASEALASILKMDPDWQALPRESACVRDLLGKCLQKNPADRYRSAVELCEDLRKCQEALVGPAPKAFDLQALLLLLGRPRIAAGVAAILLLLAAGVGHLVHRGVQVRWARLQALPEIMQLIERQEYRQAFVLAQKAHECIPGDPVLEALWPDISHEVSIVTEPAGARIYYSDYAGADSRREYLGKSPIERVRHPLGVFRWVAERGGFEPREWTAGVYPSRSETLTILMSPVGSHPGMVAIPVPGKKPFRMDAYEVTNEEYQAFVDGNGYARRELWRHPFVDDAGRDLSWEDAMRRFVDKTGRAGPSTWEWGAFPAGQGRYPVGGVSWYEAAAYAEFAGKDLCVVDAWGYGAGASMGTLLADRSNFGGAAAPVGQHRVVGPFGLYDAAGNVKEWCYNATDERGSQRYILGGSWADRPYMFATHRDVRPPMNREPTNGFRCAEYDGGIEALDEELVRPMELASSADFSGVAAVSEDELQLYRRALYGYNPTSLNDTCLVVDDSPRHWRKEKIQFDAAYGGERVTAYLLVPKRFPPPYQPVVFFPGSGTQDAETSERLLDVELVELLVKGGRAVLYPVYKGTYERKLDRPPPSTDLEGMLEWMRWVVKDLGRSIDYLEYRAKERGDIEMEKLTYCGQSWGALFGPVMLALEPRLRSGVLVTGGFVPMEFDPAMDPVRFAPLVKVPVLMLNGRWDSLFPAKSSAEPMYERLGTPTPLKSLRVYDGGHDAYGLFYWQIQSDMREWMDEIIGPTEGS